MPASAATILVVDEEPDLRTLYVDALLGAGYRVESVADVAAAQSHLELFVCDVVVCSMRHSASQGLGLLQWLQQMGRPERCIVLTAQHPTNFTVEALRAGAYDCLTLPVNHAQLASVVASAVRSSEHTVGATSHRAAAHPIRLNSQNALQQLIGSSPAIQHIKQRIPLMANSMAPVLITGEAGTGKELLARTLHACSHRAQGPWVTFHCRSVPEEALDLVFFGGRSPSDAPTTPARAGLFQIAKGGTLLIHEVEALPRHVQSSLLRVMQERRVEMPGQGVIDTADVRVLAATHSDLRLLAKQGLFDSELYTHLSTLELTVPPLRERREDLPALCNVLLARMAHELGIQPPSMSASLQLQLMQMPLYGNVYELKHLLHQSIAPAQSTTAAQTPALAPFWNAPDLSVPHRIDSATQTAFQTNHYAPAPYFPSGVVTQKSPLTFQAAVVGNQVPHHQTSTLHTDAQSQGMSIGISTTAVRHFSELPYAAYSLERQPHPVPSAVLPGAINDLSLEAPTLPHNLPEWLDEQERRILLHALQLHGYNRSAAAARLGISLRQMRYRIERLQIPMEADESAPSRTHDP